MTISLEKFGSTEVGAPALLFILDRAVTRESVSTLFSELSSEFRVGVLITPIPPERDLKAFVTALAETMDAEGLKRPTVIGIRTGAKVAQFLAIYHSKALRRVVLVDAESRALPSLLTRIVEKLSCFFPAGLPLRVESGLFDSRSMLHRITVPALVLLSPHASAYLSKEWIAISERIPNAWRKHLDSQPFFSKPDGKSISLSKELLGVIRTFSNVAVKRPQKNLKSSSKSSTLQRAV